jgi:hypothetical protein
MFASAASTQSPKTTVSTEKIPTNIFRKLDSETERQVASAHNSAVMPRPAPDRSLNSSATASARRPNKATQMLRIFMEASAPSLESTGS